MCLLTNRIGDYFFISQGKTRIPGVNDGLEMEDTDVSPPDRLPKFLSIFPRTFSTRCLSLVNFSFDIIFVAKLFKFKLRWTLMLKKKQSKIFQNRSFPIFFFFLVSKVDHTNF